MSSKSVTIPIGKPNYIEEICPSILPVLIYSSERLVCQNLVRLLPILNQYANV